MDLAGPYSNSRGLRDHLCRLKLQTHPLAGAPLRPLTPTPVTTRVEQRVDPACLDRLVADYEAGVATTELTRRYKIGKGTVLRLLSEHGAVMRRQGPRPEQTPDAVRLSSETTVSSHAQTIPKMRKVDKLVRPGTTVTDRAGRLRAAAAAVRAPRV